MCWYSKSSEYVLYPSLYSHHNSAHLRGLNQNICLETKSLFIVSEPLSGWRGSVSLSLPGDAIPHFLHFFSPSPVSVYHGSIDWNVQGQKVSLWATKKLFYTLLMFWYSNQLTGTVPAVIRQLKRKYSSDLTTTKKLRPADWIDLKLILTKAGGELWQFRIDLGFFYSTALVN